jgi:hypothetical protein
MHEPQAAGGGVPIDRSIFAAAWAAGRTLPQSAVIAEALAETEVL